MVSSISFCALNFPRFHRQKLELQNSQVRISLIETPNPNENVGSYSVTHTGGIEPRDGQTFSVAVAETLLRGLRAFLSFARGAGCGLILVKASCVGTGEAYLEWGCSYTAPWETVSDTWLSTNVDGGANLSQAFPGFWELTSDPHWKAPLFRIIDFYLHSRTGPFHVGIILIQAALEILCVQTYGSKNEERELLKESGVSVAVPPACEALVELFSDCPSILEDGPKAIKELRNDLVHPKKRYPDSPEAQMDALRLGQWYVELSLLKKFQYHGRYKNRLAESGENPWQLVPWAKGDRLT